MLQVAIIGIVAIVLATQFKSTRSEFATYISVAACIIILFIGTSKLSSIIEGINKIQSFISINPTYLGILLKIVGITYIAEFASALCKDAGHGAIANQIELVGKLTILAISMPILLALMNLINDFLA